MEQSERSERRASNFFIHLSVSSHSSLSHFVFCLFPSLVCHWPLLSPYQPTAISLPHTLASHASPSFSPWLFFQLIRLQESGRVENNSGLGPRVPGSGGALSASPLKDWRIRLAWRDTDNNLQVQIKTRWVGRVSKMLKTLLSSLQIRWRGLKKNRRNRQTDAVMFLWSEESAYPLSGGAGNHAANGCFATGMSWE